MLAALAHAGYHLPSLRDQVKQFDTNPVLVVFLSWK